MSFNGVAKFQGVEIYTRRPSPEEALDLAEGRRATGADSVWVYDQDWQFIGARDLTEHVNRRNSPPATPGSQRGTGGVTWTVQSQPDPVASANEINGQARRRVRVFKASKLHDDRG